MIRERLEQAARFNHAMGDPLSRIQLAASELQRGVATPRDRDLLSRIGRAVVELDGLSQAMQSVLGPCPPQGDATPLGPLLEELHERLAPAVLARGFRWYPPDRPTPSVVGDPRRVRIAAIETVRAATTHLEANRGLQLGLWEAADRQGVVLTMEGEGPGEVGEQLAAAAGDAQRLAVSLDGGVEIESEGDEVRMVLWWPTGSPM